MEGKGPTSPSKELPRCQNLKKRTPPPPSGFLSKRKRKTARLMKKAFLFPDLLCGKERQQKKRRSLSPKEAFRTEVCFPTRHGWPMKRFLIRSSVREVRSASHSGRKEGGNRRRVSSEASEEGRGNGVDLAPTHTKERRKPLARPDHRKKKDGGSSH